MQLDLQSEELHSYHAPMNPRWSEFYIEIVVKTNIHVVREIPLTSVGWPVRRRYRREKRASDFELLNVPHSILLRYRKGWHPADRLSFPSYK